MTQQTDERLDLWHQRKAEQDRLLTYQRQRREVHARFGGRSDERAEELDYLIALTRAIIDHLSDEITDREDRP